MTYEKFETAQPLDKAKEAIRHALTLIRDDANLGYHAGEFTQTFDYLCAAHAALNNLDEEQVQDDFSPLNSDKANACVIEKIKKALEDRESHEISTDEFHAQVSSILKR